jgi:hypothetical protein
MNRDDIIRMAQEAGWEMGDDLSDGFGVRLERFALLVAAAAKAEEREACAKLCEDGPERQGSDGTFRVDHHACAAAIRARGESE